MANRGIRRYITKTDLLKYVECTSLWNVKSITEERKVVRYASGMQRCIRRNAGHDSRTLWTMKVHRQQTASASEPNVEMQEQAAGGSAPQFKWRTGASCGQIRMLAAESSAGQPTSSVVRTLEAEDDTSAKRQRLMDGMPILHETDVDVNMDAHKLVVLAAMLDDQGQWTQRVIDWDKKYYGAKSGNLLDTQKCLKVD